MSKKTRGGKERKPGIVCPNCGARLIRVGRPNSGGYNVIRYECSKCDTDVDIDNEGDVTVITSPNDERYRV